MAPDTQPAQRPEMTRAVKIYIAIVIAMAMPVLLSAVVGWESKNPFQTAAYILIAVGTAGTKVQLPGINGTMSAGFFMSIIALVELSLSEVVVLGALSSFAQSVWNTKNRPNAMRAGFNLSVIIIANSGTHYFLHSMLPSLGLLNMLVRVILGASAYFVLNSVLVGMAITLTEKKSLVAILREYCLWGYPFYLVGAAIAGVASSVNRVIGWETTVAAFPVIYIIQRSYRFYLDKLEIEKKHVTEMASLHLRTIEALALAIDAKDDTTHDHLRRVQGYAVEIGRDLGLDDTELEAIRAAALLHDIGKLAVPEHIICKPGKLTPNEFAKIKIHPIVGAEILEQVEFPYPVVPIVRSHHERWDGTGYPDGLAGEQIPIGARILSAVDCLDALASDRPYRKAMPLDAAMDRVREDSGKAYDPKVVEILGRRYLELEESSKKVAGKRRKKLSKNIEVRRGARPAVGFDESTDPKVSTSGDFMASIAAARLEGQVLFEVAHELGNSLSLNETLSVVASRMEKLIPHDAIAIFVRSGQILRPEYVQGEDFRMLSSLEIPVGEGLSGFVAESQLSIINGNPAVEASYTGDPNVFSVLRSALAFPLVDDKGSTLAVLTLYRLEKEAFVEDQQRILEQFSPKITIAIANALRFQQAENSATIDALTGLPNARALFAHLDAELAKGKLHGSSVAVLVCDLDGFKAVNDKFGHLEGNRVLQIVAKGFKESLREKDYVARMGGDEFVFVLPGVHSEDVEKLVPRLEKVARAAGAEVTGGDALSVSVGPAVFPDNGSDAEELLSIADKCMYKNKAANKKKYGIPGRGEVSAPPVPLDAPQAPTIH